MSSSEIMEHEEFLTEFYITAVAVESRNPLLLREAVRGLLCAVWLICAR